MTEPSRLERHVTEYEREWTTRRGIPSRSRLRFGLTKRTGVPVRFVVQLECYHDGTWLPVARFDHDASGPGYRNVELVGLHLDVYDTDGDQIEKITRWNPQPADEAMGEAEGYLRRHAQQYVSRFEGWL